MNSKVKSSLNEQINKEFFSAYLYLSFANYCVSEGLDGFANWYRVQAQEERDHAMLMVTYLQNNDETVEYEAIKKPGNTWKNALEVLKEGLAHEKFITSSINKIYDIAIEVKDYRTTQFLDWFIKEQNEEENSASLLIKKAEMLGTEGKGLYLLDRELIRRVYTPGPKEL